MADSIKFSVPEKPEYIRLLRLAISSAANTAGFDVETIEDIKVAVSEACTNVIQHGIKTKKNYEVECIIEENKMTIFVEDSGCGFDLQKYEEPNLDSHKERGLGFYIIKALMDEVDVCERAGGGTSIKMVKYVA